MNKSLLKYHIRRKVNMAPPNASKVTVALNTIEIVMKNRVITIRMEKATDLTLEEIAKEINKDVELPLSSDTDMEILMSRIKLRSQKEMMECGNVNDNALSDSEKETLRARIKKSIEGVASKVSLNTFRAITMMFIENFD